MRIVNGFLSKIVKKQTVLMDIKNRSAKKEHFGTPFDNSCNKLRRQTLPSFSESLLISIYIDDKLKFTEDFPS